MAGRPLSLLRWQAAYAWRRMGWELAAAAVLLLASGMLAWQAQLLDREAHELRVDTAAQAHKPRPVLPAGDAAETRRRVASFQAQLPGNQELAAGVKRMFMVAEKNQVRLAQGEYRPVPDATAELIRYQITLPVKGEVAKLNGFLLDALAELPSLGLEGVAFKRESPADGEMEARFRFFLLARAQ